MKNYNPFDGNQSIKIGDLTIENSEDKLIIYGDLEISRDKIGLKNIEELLIILEETKQKLIKENLQEKTQNKDSVIVQNPFKR